MLTLKGRFYKSTYKTKRILMIFEVRGVEKSIKNRSKNEVNMGWYLGIDFSSILVDLGSQVGRQNRAKIDQKWHRKNDEKKKGNKMAKKSQFEILTPRDPTGPEPRGGGRGRGKPLPEGEVGVVSR